MKITPSQFLPNTFLRQAAPTEPETFDITDVAEIIYHKPEQVWSHRVPGTPVSVVREGLSEVVVRTQSHGRQQALHRVGEEGVRLLEGQKSTRKVSLPDGRQVRLDWDSQPGVNDFRNLRLVCETPDGEVSWLKEYGDLRYSSASSPFTFDPILTPDGSIVSPRPGGYGVECHTQDGEEKWTARNQMYGDIARKPSVAADGTTFLVERTMPNGMMGGNAYVIHGIRPNGERWQQVREGLTGEVVPTEDHGALILTNHWKRGSVIERLSADGKVEWTSEALGDNYSSLAYAKDGGILLAGGEKPALNKYYPGSGMLWSLELPDRPVGLPAVLSNGDVVVATADGRVSAFRDLKDDPQLVFKERPEDALSIELEPDWVVVGGVPVERN